MFLKFGNKIWIIQQKYFFLNDEFCQNDQIHIKMFFKFFAENFANSNFQLSAIFFKQLDPDLHSQTWAGSDPEGKVNADPCISGPVTMSQITPYDFMESLSDSRVNNHSSRRSLPDARMACFASMTRVSLHDS